MEQSDNLDLSETQRRALDELQSRLFSQFGSVEDIILYGSIVRGEADSESDIDLLVVTSHPLTRTARHEITDAVFEVNPSYGTNLSTLVVDRLSWESGPVSVLPIREEVLTQGIPL